MYTALNLAQRIKNKEISCYEVTKKTIDNIEKADTIYNSFITVDKENALKKAKKFDLEYSKSNGEKYNNSKLAGVPIAIKDNICTKDLKTTCASKILENFVPHYSAEVIEKLENSGCIIIGKTNMDEFAMGSTTETSHYGVTKNPFSIERVAGGSSGGSCVAVAKDMCNLALGSDTGGSIRQPSSYCGVVGIKPTYSTVSRYGLISYASSLEQIGTIAKNVTDCITLLECIAGYDKKDSTSICRKDYAFTKYLKSDVKGLKIGLPKSYFSKDIDNEIKEKILNVAKELEKAGAIVEEFDIEMLEYTLPTYYIIACAEASSNLSRFDGVKYGYRANTYNGLHEMYKKSRTEGFGLEVKRRMMLGSYVLSSGYYDEYYLKALKVRNMINKSFEKAFEKYDCILTPVTPTTAPKINDSIQNPLKMYLSDLYTVSVNLIGLPAISIPCGFDKKGLPIGCQIIGNKFREDNIIRCAYTYEKIRWC